MATNSWKLVGEIDQLKTKSLQEITIEDEKIALTYLDGNFSAVSGVCLHAKGPLGKGKLDGEYIVCPWHNWKFHHSTGAGEPEYKKKCIQKYMLKIEDTKLYLDLSSATHRYHISSPAHPLTREIAKHSSGPLNIVGISTTNMDNDNPRISTSDYLLEKSLTHAKNNFDIETRLINLRSLKFRTCEGYYSKSANACTWPCSITQMDPTDQMDQVYEAIVHWADVILIATPIRWGSASSLYYKMVERLNCVQNQITINKKELIKNKTVGMIIVGGQDNIQSVAGHLLGFFAEIGCVFPPFPYIAHSRGWTSEDMEKNVNQVLNSKDLRSAAEQLVERAIETATSLRERENYQNFNRAGRKAHKLEMEL